MSWPTAPPPSRRRSSWWSTGVILAALAAVAAAMLIVPPLLAPPESSTSQPATPSGGPSVALSPYRSVAWEIKPFAADAPDTGIASLIVVGDRIVAVGTGAVDFLAWISDDAGDRWSRVPTPDLTAPVEGAILRPARVAADGDRIVAAGMWWNPVRPEPLAAFLLVSDDRGGSWRQIVQPPQLLMTDFSVLIGTSQGFLAYGSDSQRGTSGWWDSADGNGWAPTPVSGFPGGPPRDAINGPAGLVAVGELGAGTSTRPAAWFSPDGHDWERTLDEPTSLGVIDAAAGSATGYTLAGRTWDDPTSAELFGTATVWRSSDGHAWTATKVSEEPGWGVVGVAANDAGAVVMTVNLSEIRAGRFAPRAVFLPTGADATSAIDMPLGAAMVAIGDRFVGVGTCVGNAVCSGPYVVIGTPSESTNAPAPTIPGG